MSSYRDLRVTVDTSLRFHQHVSGVVGTAWALMGELLRGKVCRNREFMVTLFVSHIKPILDYCSCVWNVGYLPDVLKMLSSVQRCSIDVLKMFLLRSLRYSMMFSYVLRYSEMFSR